MPLEPKHIQAMQAMFNHNGNANAAAESLGIAFNTLRHWLQEIYVEFDLTTCHAYAKFGKALILMIKQGLIDTRKGDMTRYARRLASKKARETHVDNHVKRNT